MGKRYYCDYCDRSFPYSVEGYRKHISGYQHAKLKKIHYDQFKSPCQQLNEELSKISCKAFHSGHCSFGPLCNYSHLTALELDILKNEAFEEVNPKTSNFLEKSSPLPALMNKRKSFVAMNSADRINDLSPHLNNIPSIPVSLLPFTIKDIIDCDFADWG